MLLEQPRTDKIKNPSSAIPCGQWCAIRRHRHGLRELAVISAACATCLQSQETSPATVAELLFGNPLYPYLLDIGSAECAEPSVGMTTTAKPVSAFLSISVG